VEGFLKAGDLPACWSLYAGHEQVKGRGGSYWGSINPSGKNGEGTSGTFARPGNGEKTRKKREMRRVKGR